MRLRHLNVYLEQAGRSPQPRRRGRTDRGRGDRHRDARQRPTAPHSPSRCGPRARARGWDDWPLLDSGATGAVPCGAHRPRRVRHRHSRDLANRTLVPAQGGRAAHGTEALLGEFDAIVEDNDHVDVHWWTHPADTAQAQQPHRRFRLDHSRAPGRGSRMRCWPTACSGSLPRAGQAAPRFVPALSRLTTQALPRRTYSDVAHRVLTSSRRVRFVETEWALPRAASAVPCFRELAGLIAQTGRLVAMPIQVRVAPGGRHLAVPGVWPRPTAYIAAHVPARVPYEDYFGDVEDLMSCVRRPTALGEDPHPDGGRPAHFPPPLRRRPAVRDRVDPHRRFANRYLRQVLGP